MIAGPDPTILTASQFLEQRNDMPECGQWSELHHGRPFHFQPPDVDHGNAILNLSKHLAGYFQSQPQGYACFDLGLLVKESPDTILFPAIAIYMEGQRFAEADLAVSTTVPSLVVEMASTSDRKQYMASRVEQYLDWGISGVWQIDTHKEIMTVVSGNYPQRFYEKTETVESIPELPSLSFSLAGLFAIPDWYR
jgi:Uma2 family endonuclease